MTHAELVARAAAWLRGRMRCGVVLTERNIFTGEIPDVIGWDAKGTSHLVECKVSRSDFFADVRKPHRIDDHGMGACRWYFVPPALVTCLEVPERFGLAEVGPGRVRVVRWALNYKRSELARSHEQRLVLSELRRYQLHGITYPPLQTKAPRMRGPLQVTNQEGQHHG